MKATFIATLLSLTAAIPTLSHARDTVHMLPFQTIVQKMTAENKLDGSVKFYLAGNTPSRLSVYLQWAILIKKKIRDLYNQNYVSYIFKRVIL